MFARTRQSRFRFSLTHALYVSLLLFPLSRNIVAQAHPQTMVVNGNTNQVDTLQVNGRTYVEIESLAQALHGSVDLGNNQIVLTLPSSTSSGSPGPSSPEDSSALSRDFIKAGMESIAEMREWASTLASAIQNGYHVTDAWAANYQNKAAHSVQLASAAASTDADRNALQLLNNEFASVRDWSEKLVQARESMDTAKYSTSEDALRNDPSSQKIINCGHFLSSMLGSGKFQDDMSCH